MQSCMQMQSTEEEARLFLPPDMQCMLLNSQPQPHLMEPIYLADILCPSSVISGVYNVLYQHRGVVIEESPQQGTP